MTKSLFFCIFLKKYLHISFIFRTFVHFLKITNFAISAFRKNRQIDVVI